MTAFRARARVVKLVCTSILKNQATFVTESSDSMTYLARLHRVALAHSVLIYRCTDFGEAATNEVSDSVRSLVYYDRWQV